MKRRQSARAKGTGRRATTALDQPARTTGHRNGPPPSSPARAPPEAAAAIKRRPVAAANRLRTINSSVYSIIQVRYVRYVCAYSEFDESFGRKRKKKLFQVHFFPPFLLPFGRWLHRLLDSSFSAKWRFPFSK